MNILVLSDDFPPYYEGGVEKIACNLAKGYQKEGHSVSVITTVQKKKEEGGGVYENLEVFKIYDEYHPRWRAYRSLYNPPVITELKDIIKNKDIDVVHAHNVHYYLSYHSLKLLKKKKDAKIILTAHDGMMVRYHGKITNFIDREEPPFDYNITWWDNVKRAKKRYNPFRNLLIRYYLGFVDNIVAVSNALKTALKNNGINKDIKVIHNGIDTSDWEVEQVSIEKFESKFNLQDKKVVLFGGRLSYRKGAKHIIEVMEQVTREIPDSVLLVLGDKEKARSLYKRCSAEGGPLELGDNFLTTGWIQGQELRAAFHCSDIVVIPSICLEAFGLMALEAFACKKPVVGTIYGGTSEIIDNKNGYLVDPLDIKDFTSKLIKLFNCPEKLQNMGENGFKKIKEKFTIKKQTKEYLQLFQEIDKKQK